jgi:tyrosyl-tRNA synthetase
MDTEERVRIVLRGLKEIITVDDLRDLLEVESRPKAYIGVEPSGQTF